MDDRRFDSLTRALASGASRRSILKGLLGLGGAATIGGLVLEGDADAARRGQRPTSTPKPRTCPGIQHWDGTRCVCPFYLSQCNPGSGPTCCNDHVAVGPGYSECCNNACCRFPRQCVGEERCCNRLPEVGCLDDFGNCCATLCEETPFATECCPIDDFCPGGGGSPDLCCNGDTPIKCNCGTSDNVCLPGTVDACCGVDDCNPPDACTPAQCRDDHTCNAESVCQAPDSTCCGADASGCVDISSDPNNCGGCGLACTGFESCGGAGIPLQCGCSPTFTPADCDGVTCGDYPDGCGATITCGCAAGYTCAADRGCVVSSCTSSTVAAPCDPPEGAGGEGICQEDNTCCVPSGSYAGGVLGEWCSAINCCRGAGCSLGSGLCR